MTAIKDLVDLVAQLDQSIKDRRTRDLFLPLKEKTIDVRGEMLELKTQHADEIATLKAEHAKMKTQIEEKHAKAVADFQSQIDKLKAKQAQPEHEYTEHRGVLFRRLANGKIQDEAYCPVCKIPMTSLQGMLPFSCSKCERSASFTGRDIKRIIAEIDA